MAIETPSYKVLKKQGKIEIREYQPYLIASVYVSSESYGSAGSYGFRALADYIFGDNTKAGKIPMTAPVNTEMSEQIPMTAPVDTTMQNGKYKVSFTMPASYTMQDIPKPNNKEVTLEEVPKHKTAAIVFAGYTSQTKVESKISELIDWAKDNSIKLIGSAILSRYDSPWKPGFIRRNEVSFKVA